MMVMLAISLEKDYQRQEKEAALFAKKQMSYKLLDADDDDDEGAGSVTATSAASQPGKKESHRKRFRRKNETQDDEDDEVTTCKDVGRQVRSRTSEVDDGDNDSESEAARIRDQEAREQLERNIRERDAAGTRKLMESKVSKEEEEMIRRSAAMEQDDTSDLRVVSRQMYFAEKAREEAFGAAG
ncbi:pre-mRNA-splicing factor ATP-dependent RNA helicase DEAH1-like isoform X2 [Dioscorea cayenensis subsp. rotundata]|uniref:Pre-mRNA-splicing factor ATP-dependent RNA helicase DEAH1-like isoform X2 n=1 Tax=Dioscorea cayennensis subsp. rotundata TaxID=55577 RepID=A0AB40BKE4_DIOCR|nr:pre-mRNA-splicing factor ATP-dependent RNA helicase DEAH1-like isoform X2 [Dioscorea cayenensis subsp. rotundata]